MALYNDAVQQVTLPTTIRTIACRAFPAQESRRIGFAAPVLRIPVERHLVTARMAVRRHFLCGCHHRRRLYLDHHHVQRCRWLCALLRPVSGAMRNLPSYRSQPQGCSKLLSIFYCLFELSPDFYFFVLASARTAVQHPALVSPRALYLAATRYWQCPPQLEAGHVPLL